MMPTKAEEGFLILADISGYTRFLVENELEHSTEILRDLLDYVTAGLSSLFTISTTLGDAILAHLPAGKVSRGETLLELIESAYVGFRDLRQTMLRQTTCLCKACQALPTLDLKFVIHFGKYLVSKVDGKIQLEGLDVKLVTDRLLKKQVDTTLPAYLLLTGPALEHLAVHPESMKVNAATYEYLGRITTYQIDLAARYDQLTSARRHFVEPDQADSILVFNTSMMSVELWNLLNDLSKRSAWIPHTLWTPQFRPNGRTEIGATNHCVHGKRIIIEHIQDWKPFDYYTIEMCNPTIALGSAILTYQFTPISDGTQLKCLMKCKANLPNPLRHAIGRLLGRILSQRFERLMALEGKINGTRVSL